LIGLGLYFQGLVIRLGLEARGVVVLNAAECRSGKYLLTGTALRQILFITVGTLILQRSGKSAQAAALSHVSF